MFKLKNTNMATIKFYRSQNAPSNPQEGFIWFNSANNTIQLYKNGAWEIYTGKINDVTYTDGVLTITPHTGNPVSVNLGNVANIEGIATRLGTLETTVNNTLAPAVATLVGADTVPGSVANKIKTAIEGLDNNGVTGEGTFVDVTVTQVDGIVTGVSVSESNIASASDLTAVEKKIDNEVTRATEKDGVLETAINTQKDRIDALVGADAPAEGETQMSVREIVQDEVALQLESENISDSFDTLKEMAEWLSSHPEDVAEMNDAIGKNTTGVATNAADIVTIKSDIETINTAIEENELTVASALTDLDARVTALTENTVKSVDGQNYVEATTTEGAVVVKATTGAVASGADGLAVASDVKTYVDTCIASSWEWVSF